MLRFVIRRRELDHGTGLATESLETVDADCAELERVLRGGGLDPHGAYDHREVAGVEVLPDDMARLMKLSQWQAGEIERLRERVFELEADPKSGDVIPLAEPRCSDLRRSAERCITAWTVVRGGVWDPNGLMDEHMAALRKALGPNAKLTGQGGA